jgi:glycerol 2-dehydrogenase (NADP+)
MISPPSKCTPNKDLDWLDTWSEMERVYLANKAKVKAIGVRLSAKSTVQWEADRSPQVSNFSVPYLESLLKVAKVIPAVNQIENHP